MMLKILTMMRRLDDSWQLARAMIDAWLIKEPDMPAAATALLDRLAPLLIAAERAATAP